MNNFNSSYVGLRTDLLKFIQGQNNSVLDVGCATGMNGAFLLEKKLAQEVYGVEYDEEMAAEAAKANTGIFQGDLNDLDFRRNITSNIPDLDYIIFGDILEHLYNPEIVLKDFSEKLKPGGKIILSLPNIGHIELFLQIYIKGTWPRNSRGIFDITHLRWFTRKDAFSLIEKCGLKIVSWERNFRARDAIGSAFNWKYNLLKAINKDWVTFQYIIVSTNE